MSKIISVKCKNCGKVFETYQSNNRKFCSKKCYHEHKSKEVEYIEFTCEQCGKSFKRLRRSVLSSMNKGQKIRFCSKKCKSNYWGRNQKEVICPVCGKTFLQQENLARLNYNYCCSPECSAKSPYNRKNKNRIIHCAFCEKEIIRKDAYKDYNGLFCSKECAKSVGELQKNLVKENKETSKKKISPNIGFERKVYKPREKEFICEKCNKPFYAKYERKYCSKECRTKNKREFEIKCAYCGKIHKVDEYKFKRGQKYCSMECWNKARTVEKDTYEKLSHYLRSLAIYANWRKTVCDNAKWQCEHCGKKINGDLEVHHKVALYKICKKYEFDTKKILGSQEFNDPNNGECLCLNCHIKEHPYDPRLRNKKGQFCRLEFKTT